MRFLVVNNYSKAGTKGIKQFAKFVEILRKSVERSENISDLSNDYTLVEDLHEIDKFLVDPLLSSGHGDAKAFDLIDVVLVVGNNSNLPWSTANMKVQINTDLVTQSHQKLFGC
jgi:hypothetical protein